VAVHLRACSTSPDPITRTVATTSSPASGASFLGEAANPRAASHELKA
jgi:hypothetical protein